MPWQQGWLRVALIVAVTAGCVGVDKNMRISLEIVKPQSAARQLDDLPVYAMAEEFLLMASFINDADKAL